MGTRSTSGNGPRETRMRRTPHAPASPQVLDPTGATALSLAGSLLAAVDSPVLIVDRRGAVCLANPAFLDLLDADPAAVIGVSLEPILDPQSRPVWQDFLRASFDNGLLPRTTGRAALRLCGEAAGGTVVTACGVPLELGNERLLQVVLQEPSVDSDPNEPRVDYQRLLDEIQRIRFSRRQLMDSLPALVLIVDAERNIIDCNAAVTQRLGRPREELLGTRLCALRLAPNCTKGPCICGAADGSVGTQSYRFESAALGGAFLMIGSPLTAPDGRPLGSICVIVDVTEERQLERQLAQAQKMESVGALASGIAHDFRNLLTSVLIGASVLRTRLNGCPAEIGDLLSIVEQSASRGADLAQRLLAFSRVGPRESEAVDVRAVVEETTRLLRGTFGPQIALTWECEAAVPFVWANATLLQQVLINLAINARDAVGEKGAIHFHAANAPADRLSPHERVPCETGQALLLEVTDDGCGIPPEILPRIYEPFFTTKGPESGTGLGLSMVYNIVREFGGKIDVRSEVGKGSTFRLIFPVTSERPAEVRRPARALPRGSERILVVDDEVIVCELAATILHEFGYQVLTASNGEEALETYERSRDRIDLVIFDLLMPGMSGKDLLQELRRRNPELRMILSSGCLPDLASATPALAVDVPVVHKPYSVAELVGKVREVLDAPPGGAAEVGGR